MFSDKRVIMCRLCKIAGNARCRGEAEEGLEQWVYVLEVQKLGQEEESGFGKASGTIGTSKGASGAVGRGVDAVSTGRLAQWSERIDWWTGYIMTQQGSGPGEAEE